MATIDTDQYSERLRYKAIRPAEKQILISRVDGSDQETADAPMKTIICLSGDIARGKTTVAQALADAWPNTSVRSFGDVVRTRARPEGPPTDRKSLQEIGLRLIAEGWPADACQMRITPTLR